MRIRTRRAQHFIALIPAILTVCIACSGSEPVPESPSVTSPTSAPVIATITPTSAPSPIASRAFPATPTSAFPPGCLIATDQYGNFLYPTPLPTDGVAFRSAPEPGTNIVYTGRVALSLEFTGVIQTNLILAVTNDSQAPLTVRESDFAFISIRTQSPVKAVFYGESGQQGGFGQRDIAPGTTLRSILYVDTEPSDLKTTWKIKGSLDTVDIPLLRPAPLPNPTPTGLCYTPPPSK